MVYEPGRWWAVWLAVAEDRDQLPDTAALEALGYAPTATRGQCMEPSIEALGVSEAGLDWWGEVLYFASADDARAFTESWGKPVAGVVEDVHPACDYQ